MENAKVWFFLFLIFGGGSLVLSLLIQTGWYILKRRFGFGDMTPEKITKQEKRTKLIRQWIDDQKNGGPLKGKPRPLTLDEQKGALGKHAPHRRPK